MKSPCVLVRRARGLSEAIHAALDDATASFAEHGRRSERQNIRTRAVRAATAQLCSSTKTRRDFRRCAQETATDCRRVHAIGHRIHRVVAAPPGFRSAHTRAVLLRRLRTRLVANYYASRPQFQAAGGQNEPARRNGPRPRDPQSQAADCEIILDMAAAPPTAAHGPGAAKCGDRSI